MDKMKKIFKYVLFVLLVYLLSNVITNAFIKTSFKNMENYSIEFKQPYVDVKEAKVSKRNGYIKGIVKNNTSNVIENKYMKVSLLSKNGICLGEKYIKIEKLEIAQLRNFEVEFDHDNVETFKIEIVDTMPEEEDFWQLIKSNVEDWANIIKN